ncbi:aspartic and glutamic acid-rich protein-like [Bufo bufo]|uniref:aspartic and glutamic acid-rich protein-like n=1 Tax=Bufo bufo TaxID=8384 RepID=UPI001ABE6441|nr:aspartic and glutamic acid-rich protein-like [Bufo bufo]
MIVTSPQVLPLSVSMEKLPPAAMMEAPLPGSDSRRSPPERCPRPLYSQDCPEEKLPENHQGENLMDIKVEVKDEAEEETDLWGDQQDGLIEGSPPKRCPCPLYSQDCPEEKLPEDHQDENLMDIKVEVKDEEEEETDLWGDQQGSDSGRRSPPKRYPRPLYSQDCPEEKLPENHQDENINVIKIEVKDEEDDETDLWGDRQDGLIEGNPPERCPRPLYSQDCPEEKLPENHQDENLMDIKAEVKDEAEEETDLWGDQQDTDSSRRSPPERCPRPLYSQDCPEEKLPENHQDENLMDIKVEVKDEAEEETDLWGDKQASDSRRRSPPKRCPRPLYSQDCPEEKLSENHQDENLMDIKAEVKDEEEEETDLWDDQQYGLIEGNPLERCPHPLYSQDCPEEKLPENHQDENLMDIKVEVKDEAEEETDLWGDQQDGLIERNPAERCPRPLYSQDCPEEKLPENHQKISVGTLKKISCYHGITNLKMRISCSARHKKTSLPDMYILDFTILICHIIRLSVRNLLLTNHRLVPQVQIRKRKKVFSAGNVENSFHTSQVFLYTEEFTQERNHTPVQNVGNVLPVKQALINIREFTQE